MLLGDFLRLLRRHWIIALVGCVIAIAGAVGAASVAKPTYQAKASILIMPSTVVPGVTGPVNPFQAFGVSTTTAGNILTIQVQSPQSVASILAKGGAGKYSISPDPNATGPVLDLTAESANQDLALKTLNLVIDETKAQLVDLQQRSNAPTNSFLTLQTISETPQAAKQTKGAIRSGIAAAIAVLVVTGIAMGLSETVMRRRARRRIIAAGGPPAATPARQRGPAGAQVAAVAQSLASHPTAEPDERPDAVASGTGGGRSQSRAERERSRRRPGRRPKDATGQAGRAEPSAGAASTDAPPTERPAAPRPAQDDAPTAVMSRVPASDPDWRAHEERQITSSPSN